MRSFGPKTGNNHCSEEMSRNRPFSSILFTFLGYLKPLDVLFGPLRPPQREIASHNRRPVRTLPVGAIYTCPARLGEDRESIWERTGRGMGRRLRRGPPGNERTRRYRRQVCAYGLRTLMTTPCGASEGWGRDLREDRWDGGPRRCWDCRSVTGPQDRTGRL